MLSAPNVIDDLAKFPRSHGFTPEGLHAVIFNKSASTIKLGINNLDIICSIYFYILKAIIVMIFYLVLYESDRVFHFKTKQTRKIIPLGILSFLKIAKHINMLSYTCNIKGSSAY